MQQQKEEKGMPLGDMASSKSRTNQRTNNETIRHSRDSDARSASRDEESGTIPLDDVDEKEFEVAWIGDDDPMNPRSMAFARKWIIVIILSASSLCVCVGII
jgi:hypothetical protein